MIPLSEATVCICKICKREFEFQPNGLLTMCPICRTPRPARSRLKINWAKVEQETRRRAERILAWKPKKPAIMYQEAMTNEKALEEVRRLSETAIACSGA